MVLWGCITDDRNHLEWLLPESRLRLIRTTAVAMSLGISYGRFREVPEEWEQWKQPAVNQMTQEYTSFQRDAALQES